MPSPLSILNLIREPLFGTRTARASSGETGGRVIRWILLGGPSGASPTRTSDNASARTVSIGRLARRHPRAPGILGQAPPPEAGRLADPMGRDAIRERPRRRREGDGLSDPPHRPREASPRGAGRPRPGAPGRSPGAGTRARPRLT